MAHVNEAVGTSTDVLPMKMNNCLLNLSYYLDNSLIAIVCICQLKPLDGRTSYKLYSEFMAMDFKLRDIVVITVLRQNYLSEYSDFFHRNFASLRKVQ